MCDCNGCRLQGYCKLDPDLSLKDAEMCFQLRNAEVIEVPQAFINDSYRNFTITNKVI